MGENSWSRKLRFMELMQRCFPFHWQKYWNCGIKEFDLLMILQDIDSLRLNMQDRLLLTLLARIWTGSEDSLLEVQQAAANLGREQRQILAEWIRERQKSEAQPSHATACRCTLERFNSAPTTSQKAK